MGIVEVGGYIVFRGLDPRFSPLFIFFPVPLPPGIFPMSSAGRQEQRDRSLVHRLSPLLCQVDTVDKFAGRQERGGCDLSDCRRLPTPYGCIRPPDLVGSTTATSSASCLWSILRTAALRCK